MDDSLKKKTQDKTELQEHVMDFDAVVDVSDEEMTAAFEEDSDEIEEVFVDSDSEECLSGTEESSFGDEASSADEDFSFSSVEEDSESEEEEDICGPFKARLDISNTGATFLTHE
jgi:hypothetical protein